MSTNNLLLTMQSQDQMVPAIDENISFVLERRYFDLLDPKQLELADNLAGKPYDAASDLRLIKLEEIDYQRGEDMGLHLANMQNVLSSLKDDSHNAVCIVKSNGANNGIYYGVSRHHDCAAPKIGTQAYASILSQSFQGNFFGVRRKELNHDDVSREILNEIHQQTRVLAMPGIPSLRRYADSAPYVQGLDRFIEAMRGEKYMLIFIAEPIPLGKVDGMINNLFSLATSIHPMVKATIQRNKSTTNTLTAGMFGMMGDTTGTTESISEGDAKTMMGPGGALVGALGAIGSGIGATSGFGCSLGAIGGVLSAVGIVTTWATGMPLMNTASFMRTIAHSVARTVGGGMFGNYGRSWTSGVSVSQETLNKRAEYAEELCNHYIKRLQEGKNLGFWNVGVYLLTESPATVMRAKGLLRATFSGAETHWEPMRTLELDADAIQHYIANFHNPVYNLLRYGQEKQELKEAVTIGQKLSRWAKGRKDAVQTLFKNFASLGSKEKKTILEEIRQQSVGPVSDAEMEKAWKTIKEMELGHPMGEIMGGVATPMNTEELSILCNVPRREVQGITIREVADFGGNYVAEPGESPDVKVGNIIHKCEPLEKAWFTLKRDTFTKHGFICGVTGSGKTNTCFQILTQLGVPFLVIEPAKAEYQRWPAKTVQGNKL